MPSHRSSGNPFHPLYGGVTTGLYQRLGLDRIESVGWIGIVPLIAPDHGRGKWGDKEEARRWKCVLAVFALWALGPFLTVAGLDVGLPLPQALARFVPLVENARMPGRAMVCVYLALGVLMALRLAGLKPCATANSVPSSVAQGFSLGYTWLLIALLALDYLHIPIPLTALDRPAVYEQLASIAETARSSKFRSGLVMASRRGRAVRIAVSCTTRPFTDIRSWVGTSAACRRMSLAPMSRCRSSAIC